MALSFTRFRVPDRFSKLSLWHYERIGKKLPILHLSFLSAKNDLYDSNTLSYWYNRKKQSFTRILLSRKINLKKKSTL